MKRLIMCALLLPASALANDGIIGEWALDAEGCTESRLVFDVEGNHSAIVAEEGRWETLAVAAYRVEGDLLIITHSEGEERIQIVEQERDRIVLHNAGHPMGEITTELVRCPAY
jgi:hypothetical protein